MSTFMYMLDKTQQGNLNGMKRDADRKMRVSSLLFRREKSTTKFFCDPRRTAGRKQALRRGLRWEEDEGPIRVNGELWYGDERSDQVSAIFEQTSETRIKNVRTLMQ